MTLRHFEILQAIEQTGSFTKAAEKLYLTQSAVSHAVKEMEQQTHTVLFNRFAKKVTLTECGKRLLPKSSTDFEGMCSNRKESAAVGISSTNPDRIRDYGIYFLLTAGVKRIYAKISFYPCLYTGNSCGGGDGAPA